MDWATLWNKIRDADPYAAADDLGVPLTPLAPLGASRDPGTGPGSRRRLYRVGESPDSSAYVLALPTPAPPDRGSDRVPFSFFWAPSEGAARRAARGERAADDGAEGEPPPELLLEPELLSRSDLQTWVARHQPRYVEEGFAGFSPLSGAYVRVGPFAYHFRSMRWAPDERPYAIEYDPRPVDPLFRRLAAFHYRRR